MQLVWRLQLSSHCSVIIIEKGCAKSVGIHSNITGILLEIIRIFNRMRNIKMRYFNFDLRWQDASQFYLRMGNLSNSAVMSQKVETSATPAHNDDSHEMPGCWL